MNNRDLLDTNSILLDTNKVSYHNDNTMNNILYNLKNDTKTSIKDTNMRNYIENQQFEQSSLNIKRLQGQKYPINNNANQQPILSDTLKDITRDRYEKYIATNISIDSADRDISTYETPNNYNIYLNKDFSKVVSIKLIDISMPNPIPSVSLYNNIISWSYPSKETFLSNANNLTNNENDINVVDINNYIFPTNNIKHSVTIQPGCYTNITLENAIINSMNAEKFTPDYPYNGGGSMMPSHKFTIDINPETSVVSIVNRLEELPIVSYSVNFNEINSELNRIDIGVYASENIFDTYKELPIIPTNLPDIAGIPAHIINYKEYIYVNDTDPRPKRPYYMFKYYDSYFTSGLLVGRYIYSLYIYAKNNINIYEPVIANYSVNYIYADTDILNICAYKSSVYKKNKHPTIGRSVLFNFECNDYNANGSKNTIFDILGWDINNISFNTISFIQTNLNINNMPYKIIAFERLSIDEFVLRSDAYIFLKLITTSRPADTIANNIIHAYDNVKYENNINANINDINSSNNSTLIQNRKVLDASTDNIFAKIILNAIPGNVSTKSIGGHKLFYNEPLEILNNLTIIFVDNTGKILNLTNNHNMTFEIIEKVDLLKETLINTQTGTINIQNNSNNFYIK